MKRPVAMLGIVAAAWLAAPATMAGTEIVKCVDAQGNVTLTDQPCAAGATVVKTDSDERSARPAPAPQRYILPAAELRHPSWRPPTVREVPLARDVATLKEARRVMQLLDSPRPTLALR